MKRGPQGPRFLFVKAVLRLRSAFPEVDMAKGKGGNVAAAVERIARPVVEGLGYRLWDVRYEKEGPDHFLRVFIDKDGDMDTADCETVSRALDPLIDAADPIEESYFFEVGSPGLGRRLTRPEHFEAMRGRRALVRLYHPDESGCKEYTGILAGLEDGRIALTLPDGERRFAPAEVALAKLCDDEDLFKD